jgi:hypothetical protein
MPGLTAPSWPYSMNIPLVIWLPYPDRYARFSASPQPSSRSH